MFDDDTVEAFRAYSDATIEALLAVLRDDQIEEAANLLRVASACRFDDDQAIHYIVNKLRLADRDSLLVDKARKQALEQSPLLEQFVAAALDRLGDRPPVEHDVASDEDEPDFSLSAPELEILERLKECYPLPRPQKTIMSLAHIETHVTVRKYLNLLITKGLVERIGKRGGYKITREGLRIFDLPK